MRAWVASIRQPRIESMGGRVPEPAAGRHRSDCTLARRVARTSVSAAGFLERRCRCRVAGVDIKRMRLLCFACLKYRVRVAAYRAPAGDEIAPIDSGSAALGIEHAKCD